RWITAGALAGIVATSGSARGAILSVTNLLDSGPGSLRATIGGASNGDTIDATQLSGTITLTGSAITIGANVSIVGPGANYLVVSGDNASSIFVNNGTAEISGMTIANGAGGNGGGVANYGALTISFCTLANNTA